MSKYVWDAYASKIAARTRRALKHAMRHEVTPEEWKLTLDRLTMDWEQEREREQQRLAAVPRTMTELKYLLEESLRLGQANKQKKHNATHRPAD
jgi:hypothetical protein